MGWLAVVNGDCGHCLGEEACVSLGCQVLVHGECWVGGVAGWCALGVGLEVSAALKTQY